MHSWLDTKHQQKRATTTTTSITSTKSTTPLSHIHNEDHDLRSTLSSSTTNSNHPLPLYYSTTTATRGSITLEKTSNSKFKFRIHELLFIALFKFSGYYLNSWHYSKCSLLFKFRIWIVHEHSPGSGSGTQTLHYSSTIWSTCFCKYGRWMHDVQTSIEEFWHVVLSSPGRIVDNSLST